MKITREICRLAKEFQQFELLVDIGICLKKMITLSTLKSISKIAFDYEMNDLMTKVKAFIEKNLLQIAAQNMEILIEMSDFTDDSLLKAIKKKRL